MRREDAGHFPVEPENEAQGANRLARRWMKHAVGVEQRWSCSGAQRRDPKRLDVVFALKRVCDPSFVYALREIRGSDIGQHASLQVKQHNLLVHRVLVAISGQARNCLGAARPETGDVLAQRTVCREESNVGGSLEEVTDDDVQDVLGPCTQAVGHACDLLIDQTIDQFALERLKATARGGHHGKQSLRLFGAVHTSVHLDDAPDQVEFA